MSYYLVGLDDIALKKVDVALALLPDLRNTMLLKIEILKAMGRTQEAETLADEAEFLPVGNWHETAPVE